MVSSLEPYLQQLSHSRTVYAYDEPGIEVSAMASRMAYAVLQPTHLVAQGVPRDGEGLAMRGALWEAVTIGAWRYSGSPHAFCFV
ncbi:hypothetical protein NDU88_002065 [Pleurodeles waltl]|uniref:Uncharacterized protein n=1 Tax=Pleurodeles waltl TaxID=8319 RepID=A0AAV7VBT8_PLEWA|nr:hypothetical protein NDU88_002065 [Pleurodeles waltl]